MPNDHNRRYAAANLWVAEKQIFVIRHTGTNARIRCGCLGRHPDPVLATYVEQIKAADVDITLTDSILLDIWKKFVLLSGTSGITASTRQPLGVFRDDEDMRALFYKLMHETIAVGRAAGNGTDFFSSITNFFSLVI